VVAINKIDILESEEDLGRVLAFVAENARALLGSTPDTFPVAARLAFRGKTVPTARFGGQPLRGAGELRVRHPR